MSDSPVDMSENRPEYWMLIDDDCAAVYKDPTRNPDRKDIKEINDVLIEIQTTISNLLAIRSAKANCHCYLRIDLQYVDE